MKIRALVLLLLAAIPLMGFNCVNDAFTISLNLAPFNGTYALNPGPTTFGGSFSINTTTMYDQGYTLTGASVYDITVATAGPSLGTCSGTVWVNSIPLLTYGPTSWTNFNTPQSLLSSRFITRDARGIAELISCVVNKRIAVFSTTGTVTTSPAVAGTNTLTISASVQAWGQLSK